MYPVWAFTIKQLQGSKPLLSNHQNLRCLCFPLWQAKLRHSWSGGVAMKPRTQDQPSKTLQKSGSWKYMRPGKLAWHRKIPMFNRKYIKWWIFSCHVGFRGGKFWMTLVSSGWLWGRINFKRERGKLRAINIGIWCPFLCDRPPLAILKTCPLGFRVKGGRSCKLHASWTCWHAPPLPHSDFHQILQSTSQKSSSQKAWRCIQCRETWWFWLAADMQYSFCHKAPWWSKHVAQADVGPADAKGRGDVLGLKAKGKEFLAPQTGSLLVTLDLIHSGH